LHERVTENDAQSRFPVENYQDLHDSGYLRLALPREFGGEGADVFDTVLAQEILARGDASTALVTGMDIAGRRVMHMSHPVVVVANHLCASLVMEFRRFNA